MYFLIICDLYFYLLRITTKNHYNIAVLHQTMYDEMRSDIIYTNTNLWVY